MKKTQKSYNSTLRKTSDKQKVKLALWHDVTMERAYQLNKKYGRPICEYCGKRGGSAQLYALAGHHIDHNRNNNTIENCYLVHYSCHSYIHDKNVKVNAEDFNTRELWL